MSSGNTIRLHRVLTAPVSRVFRAFLDPDALIQWLPPYGFTAKVHEMSPKEGGGYKMSFTNFTTEHSHSFRATYTEIKPNQSIKHTDTFDDPNLPGEMVVTITFKEVSCGTEIHITQENVPAVIPPEMCYLGWQESLKKLAHLVEPEINQ
jgi:uncharacterized protein YndB with AHSA1/START domain